ncbi:2567_t:CDS:2 [Ambispora gerdemannii]|uniref:2567_t:CDS:1 n=1 Tax=Ambispora gerdemannii TaxID=144530 RepID=A0A9N8ZK95_9GLOM|nr:2567_t:CDS:2 [Ambispora gerdemannii]
MKETPIINQRETVSHLWKRGVRDALTLAKKSDRCALGRIITNDKYLTCAEITTKLQSKVEIFTRTINCKLNKLGYHSKLPKTVSLLSEKHRLARVE